MKREAFQAAWDLRDFGGLYRVDAAGRCCAGPADMRGVPETVQAGTAPQPRAK